MAIIVSKAHHATPIHLDRALPPMNTNDLEAVAATINLSTGPINVASVYMPHGPTHEALGAFSELLSLLTARRGNTLIGGDFNAHHRRWDKRAADPAARLHQDLLDTIEDVPLTILNNGDPTFVSRANGARSALDLTMCDATLTASATWRIIDPVVASDHDSVVTHLRLEAPPRLPAAPRTVWKVRDVDWEEYANDAAPWQDWLRTANLQGPIDDLYNSWLAVFQSVALKHAGSITFSGPATARRPRWWTQEIQHLRRARNRARKRLRRRPTPANRRAWLTAMKAARDALQTARAADRVELAKELSTARMSAPALFWTRFNQEVRPQSSCSSPPVCLPGDRLTNSAEEAAETLNIHFTHTCASRETHAATCDSCVIDTGVLTQYRNNIDAFRPVPNDPARETPFTRKELDTAIANLRTASAGGPDTVLPVFLKNAGNDMRNTVLAVINASWSKGQLPRLWKAANVRAVLKPKSETTAPSNFRPISLLSVVGKLCERLVYDRILPTVARHFPQHQSGFRHHRSTLDCITRFVLAVSDAFEHDSELVGVFVDIDKAYDTVWRKGLLVKLLNMGVERDALAWISDFLYNRVQRTVVDGAMSAWSLVQDGVPQGSVLSCLLYLAFSHDALGTTPDCRASFADDLLLWASGPSALDACAALQPRLSALQAWASRNLCHASARKSVCTIFRKCQWKPSIDPVLMLGGGTLRHDPLPKYLGVTLAPNLSWQEHSRATALAITRTLAAIRRLCGRGHSGAPPAVMIALIRALVEPLLDYAAPVWHGAPASVTDPLASARHQSLVAATGAFATTSLEALAVDAYMLPPNLRRDLLSLRWEARILRLGQNHPLRTHWVSTVHPRLVDGNLGRWRQRQGGTLPQRLRMTHRHLRLDYEDPATVEAIDTRLTPPDAWPELVLCPNRESACEWTATTVRALRARGGAAVVFTDGSYDSNADIAAAACSFEAEPGPPTLLATRMPPGLAACSFAAEVFGIMLAIDDLLHRHGPYPSSAHIFCDSLAALEVLSGRSTPSGYVSLCNAAFGLLSQLQARSPVSLYWIPGHSSIPENERVDASAKDAATRDPTPLAARLLATVRVPYAATVVRIRKAIFAEWNRTWERSEHGAHLRDIIPALVPPHGRWSADRRRDVTLCRLRLGQCLNEFLHRVGQAPTAACAMPGCRERESVDHFLLRCPVRAHHRAHLLRSVRELLAASNRNPDDYNDDDILSLNFLLGSAAPAPLRSPIGDCVYRYFNDCSSP